MKTTLTFRDYEDNPDIPGLYRALTHQSPSQRGYSLLLTYYELDYN